MKEVQNRAMKEKIVCLEGPSGVGKTVMCELLSSSFTIVPEVNLLFQKSENDSKFWYHEKQVERYQLCQQSEQPALLDGDIFQPIWYNWVCDYPPEFLSKKETHSFYKTKILEGKIVFPDVYIIFDTDEKELRKRKENDTTRQRRNFEKHLKIIQPLRRYYRFLEKETDLELRFIDYTDITQTKQKVVSVIEEITPRPIDQIKVFTQIEDWIDRQ